MGKQLYNDEFLCLPMPLVSSVKNQSKLPPGSLLVGGQCLDRVTFCLKPFQFNDFNLKLRKYLMFSNRHFCVKNLKSSFPRKPKPCICNTSLPPALHNLDAVNRIVDKIPLDNSNSFTSKINTLNCEQVFCSIQLKTCSKFGE